MITIDELFVAGKVTRTHGVAGEWVCIGNTDVLDVCPYVVFCMDGLFVPFFITSRRYQSNTAWLLQVEGVDSEQKARDLVGKQVYLPLSMQEDAEQVSGNYFIDFQVYNNNEYIGVVESINDQTENILFCIQHEDASFMVPAVEAFIVDIDHKNRKLYLDLPDGLLNIND